MGLNLTSGFGPKKKLFIPDERLLTLSRFEGVRKEVQGCFIGAIIHGD